MERKNNKTKQGFLIKLSTVSWHAVFYLSPTAIRESLKHFSFLHLLVRISETATSNSVWLNALSSSVLPLRANRSFHLRDEVRFQLRIWNDCFNPSALKKGIVITHTTFISLWNIIRLLFGSSSKTFVFVGFFFPLVMCFVEIVLLL